MNPEKLLRLRVIMATTLPSPSQVLEGFHLAGALLEAYDAVVGLASSVVEGMEDPDWAHCHEPISPAELYADTTLRNS